MLRFFRTGGVGVGFASLAGAALAASFRPVGPAHRASAVDGHCVITLGTLHSWMIAR